MTSLFLEFDWSHIVRLGTAALLGGLIGIERDLHGRPAGLRTNMLIAVGACLLAILSREGFDDASGTQDPTRIASIVVQGIGFLGAGVLLKGENKVMGLTTAATIWLAAAVGLAAGAGMLSVAIFTTVFTVFFTVVLKPVSETLEKIGERRMHKQGKKIIREE